MDLVINTYDHIDAMFYTLNGIAMLMNHKFGEVLMATMTMGCCLLTYKLLDDRKASQNNVV